MKLITKDIDYAVRAIAYIAQSDKDVVSATELIEELTIPKPFLRKILQTLNKSEILKSIKGKGGGFKLSQKPENITLVNLLETFRGEIKFTDCIFNKAICSDIKKCQLRKKIKGIEKYVLDELKGVTIASLM